MQRLLPDVLPLKPLLLLVQLELLVELPLEHGWPTVLFLQLLEEGKRRVLGHFGIAEVHSVHSKDVEMHVLLHHWVTIDSIWN